MCDMFNKTRPNNFDEKKSLELIEAAMNGNTNDIDSLVKAGANINYVDEFGNTALTQAAFNGRTETVKKLLHYLSARYSKNRALIFASQAGHAEIIDILLANQAEVNVDMPEYHTPLFQAITHNKIEAFKRLLAAPDIKLSPEDGASPLLLSASSCNLEMTELLIAHKLNVCVR